MPRIEQQHNEVQAINAIEMASQWGLKIELTEKPVTTLTSRPDVVELHMEMNPSQVCSHINRKLQNKNLTLYPNMFAFAQELIEKQADQKEGT